MLNQGVLIPRASFVQHKHCFILTQSANPVRINALLVLNTLHSSAMSSRLVNTGALHSLGNALPDASRPRRNFKGNPVNLACNECRRRKVKVCRSLLVSAHCDAMQYLDCPVSSCSCNRLYLLCGSSLRREILQFPLGWCRA